MSNRPITWYLGYDSSEEELDEGLEMLHDETQTLLDNGHDSYSDVICRQNMEYWRLCLLKADLRRGDEDEVQQIIKDDLANILWKAKQATYPTMQTDEQDT